MADEVEALIESATRNGDGESDAADALLSPEQLEAVRASGRGRRPPNVTRPAEPEDDGGGATEDDDDEASTPRPRQSRKWAGYRKHEVEAEADRLAQELEDLRRNVEAAQQSRVTPDPNALRDLSFTIQFVARMGFATAAAMRGPHWQIAEDEAARIGDSGAVAMAPLAEEYAHALPWINFAASLGAPIAARIAEDRRINALRTMTNDAT